MVRIKDVAEAVGVSTATVSNVINGKEQRVSKEVREKIRQALDEMGYVRNRSAMMLAQTSSHMIGVVLPQKEGCKITLEDPYYSALAGNLDYEIRKKNCTMHLIAQQTEDEIIRQALAWNLEGLIVCNMHPEALECLCEKYRRSVVSIDAYVNRRKQFANIMTDDFDGGYQMGKYLIANGHKKIAMLADNDSSVDHHRWMGLMHAMQEAGLSVNTDDHFLFSSRESVRSLQFEQMLPQWKTYTALFVASDRYALEVCAFLQSRGVSIPQDLSVTGFDDLIYARLARPRLTTISQNIAKKAQMAVEALLSMAPDGSFCGSSILPVRLIERDSVKNLVQSE